jgi:hypothetical protein
VIQRSCEKQTHQHDTVRSELGDHSRQMETILLILKQLLNNQTRMLLGLQYTDCGQWPGLVSNIAIVEAQNQITEPTEASGEAWTEFSPFEAAGETLQDV